MSRDIVQFFVFVALPIIVTASISIILIEAKDAELTTDAMGPSTAVLRTLTVSSPASACAAAPAMNHPTATQDRMSFASLYCTVINVPLA